MDPTAACNGGGLRLLSGHARPVPALNAIPSSQLGSGSGIGAGPRPSSQGARSIGLRRTGPNSMRVPRAGEKGRETIKPSSVHTSPDTGEDDVEVLPAFQGKLSASYAPRPRPRQGASGGAGPSSAPARGTASAMATASHTRTAREQVQLRLRGELGDPDDDDDDDDEVKVKRTPKEEELRAYTSAPSSSAGSGVSRRLKRITSPEPSKKTKAKAGNDHPLMPKVELDSDHDPTDPPSGYKRNSPPAPSPEPGRREPRRGKDHALMPKAEPESFEETPSPVKYTPMPFPITPPSPSLSPSPPPSSAFLNSSPSSSPGSSSGRGTKRGWLDDARGKQDEEPIDESSLVMYCEFCSEPFPDLLSMELEEEYRQLREVSHREPTRRNPHHRICTDATTLLWAYEFCAQHRAERDLIPAARAAGWPEQIDWLALHTRLEESWARKEIDRLVRNPARSALYRRSVEEYNRLGPMRWKLENAAGSGVGRAHAGYYGDIGRIVLERHFSNLVEWSLMPELASKPKPTCAPLPVDEFIRHVLVPEAAVLLIMNDAGGAGDRAARVAALRTWSASAAYGRFKWRGDEGDVEGVERGMRRAKDAWKRGAFERREREARDKERGKKARAAVIVLSDSEDEVVSSVPAAPRSMARVQSFEDDFGEDDWMAGVSSQGLV